MLNKLKGLGSSALGLCFMVALVFLAVAILKGTAAFGAWVYPLLSAVVGVVTVIGLPLLLVLAVFGPTRAFAGGGLVIVSFAYGATVWIWSLLFTLHTWGWIAVFIGLFLAGVGVVPIALLAALFHGEWSVIGQLLLGLVLAFGCRMFGMFVSAKAEERAVRIAQ